MRERKEVHMATLFKQATTKRPPLKAKPRHDADITKIIADVSERFSVSLEYLGR
jgi:hypothetical protein